jgi:uncharacterized membrane protein YobD (UPF0266 family)
VSRESRSPSGSPPRRRLASPERVIPLPKRPYRDSAIFYGVLAVLLVVVAYLTAGALLRAVLFGAGFFLIATAWSWWRFRQRLEAEEAAAQRNGVAKP